MSYCYHLSVAGIKIRFEADRPLVENPEFLPFLTDAAQPDIHALIRKADALPKVPEAPLYGDRFFSVARNGEGCLQKFFFDSDAPDGFYTVSTYDRDGKHILIEYPSARTYPGTNLQHCFYCLGFEESLLQRSGLCLHAACVDTPLGGILFSGASGIGKSTQAELWRQYRGARPINGDRPILTKEGDKWLAWGSPYAGSSKVYVNDYCPVAAIVLLKQAKTCAVRKLSPSEAFRGVWAGLTVHSWDPEFVEKASNLAITLIAAVPVYELSCTPDEAAVNILEAELRKEYRV